MHNLVITEKPSQASAYAAALGATERGSGFYIGNNYIITWCYGHLLELATPDIYNEKYSKWRYEDLPIIPQEWLHTATKDKSEQLKILAELLNRPDVDTVINGCDAGREGELIFRLVYEHAKCTKKVKRLWISSMEQTAIKSGFENLKDGAEYENLYQAALCRSKADWEVGVNLTRLWSILYNTVLNVGRVQSPTLAMLVNRESEIANFVKKPFYTVELDCGDFTAASERFDNKSDAEQIITSCQSATITDVERVQKSVAAPKLHDLTSLQREANRIFGYTAQQTLDYTQSIYEKRYVSYPRTDSRYLTSDMAAEIPPLVKLAAYTFSFIDTALEVNAEAVIDNSKVSDHHAIIPTESGLKANLSSLPTGELNIFNLIALRLITATAPKHIYEAVTTTVTCGGNTFVAKGKTVITDGWKVFDDAFKKSLKDISSDEEKEDTTLPELSKGQDFESVTATIKEGTTSPPKHLTEDTLLSAMENAGAEEMNKIEQEKMSVLERKGIGTPATRAGIIEKLVKSGFVERVKKNLIPTDKGKNLIAVLPTALTSARLTAEWENRLLEVQRGELSADKFMADITEFTKSIVADNSKPNPEFISLFPNDRKTKETIGQCPRCGKDVAESEKGFYCMNRECEFVLWKNSKFWTAKKKPLTAEIVAVLLKNGRVRLKNLYSEKTGKTYSATVELIDDGSKFVNYKMTF